MQTSTAKKYRTFLFPAACYTVAKKEASTMHYTGTIWRPPYEAGSLLLQVTAGCTHHKCKFCTLYADLPFPFRLSPRQELESDLLEVQTADRDPISQLIARLNGIPTPKEIYRVFLTGANSFVLRTEKLLAIADLIRQYLPKVETIGCFARVTDAVQKTDEDLFALRQAGYDGLTIGMETGDDEALRCMHKGYTAADILTQCSRLDQVGIGYNFFYLTGISGAGRGEAGAKATAELCNQLHPRLIGANMLTVYSESELFAEIQRGNWEEESEVEKYQELKTLVQTLTIPVTFAAMGASNAVQLHGELPWERARLLRDIDQVLEAGESKLRQYRVTLPHL